MTDRRGSLGFAALLVVATTVMFVCETGVSELGENAELNVRLAVAATTMLLAWPTLGLYAAAMIILWKAVRG